MSDMNDKIEIMTYQKMVDLANQGVEIRHFCKSYEPGMYTVQYSPAEEPASECNCHCGEGEV